MTLQQLKQVVDVPGSERRNPTMRRLKESGKAVVHKKFDGNTEITVYKNGYVLYRVGCAATVFSVHSCGEYLYHESDKPYKIDEAMFEHEEWYLRLVLEGEDRLWSNQEAKQLRNTVHYRSVPEECRNEVNEEDPVLARVIQEETITELMEVLTEQQRDVIRRFFLYQKSQKQIAGELGVSMPAVSQKLSRAIQRIQRKKEFHRYRKNKREG
ncbi:sigma-70 family RNA polymerase sigma factor [Blautia schinkii]|nr:sigma-70 family RNA polymerase sigma factor [Blautia schinkii]